MKKTFISASIALFFWATNVNAQNDKVGRLNQDGQFNLTVPEAQGKNVLKQHSIHTENSPFEATDISITQVADGTLYLTGYLKNPGGQIVKGFRIQCSQDDDNNLIVKPGNNRERVVGHQF
jgi:type 1 fimbria pilin